MGLIYRILREFKYIFKNKNTKFFISCLIIAILFFMLISKVFAFEVIDTATDTIIDLPSIPSNVESYNYFIVQNIAQPDYFSLFYYPINSSCVYDATSNKLTVQPYYYMKNFYRYNKATDSNWNLISFDSLFDISYKNFILVYSSADILNTDGEVFFPAGSNIPPEQPEPYILYVRVDEGDYTYVNPIHAYTNWFSREDIENYSAEVSLKSDFSDSKQMYIGTSFIQESQELLARFMYDIEYNGTYYFKITNNETQKDNYFTITVRNMLGVGTIDENGDIIPPTIEEVQKQDENKYVIGIGETAQDTNKFLKDDTVNDSQFDMPSVDVNDPTANFFDTIFTGLYNAVTSNEEKTISFDLFGNTIQINSADFNFLTDNRWNVLRFILSSAWVVGIGLYILKDIRKMIDKIKDGNIEGVANDDIKADIM